MKAKTIVVWLCMISAPTIGLGAKPSGTITVKGSENTDMAANTDSVRTGLHMSVVAPQKDLKVGQDCEVRVEIQNTSFVVEVVYMPGLVVEPVFTPKKKGLRSDEFRSDEYGPPLCFGRSSARDERLNFVVLMPGDSYARTYSWKPPDEGTVRFRATYSNKRKGEDIGVKTWIGELRSASKLLRVSKE
jgi:hypothetical protein